MKEKSQAQLNKDEFVARVNQEFGGIEDWEKMQAEVMAKTGGDHVYIKKDAIATRLAREGYLVSVHIGRTRFMTKLQPQDIGLDPDDPEQKEFVSAYLNLGQKLLIPAETLKKLDRIESRIRRAIDDKYGIPTVLGSFVPYKNWEPMRAEIEKARQEYLAIRDEIIARYDDIKSATRKAYRLFAVEVCRLLRKDPQYNPTEEETDRFVRAAMNAFPSQEQVRDSFYVRVNVGIVQATAFLAEQEARLKLVEEREKFFRQELELIERQLTEADRVQRERERQQLLLERERVQTQIKQEKMKQKAIEEAIAQARAEYLPQVEQVFADLSGAVQGIVYDTLTRVTEALKTNGSLRPADSKSLACLVEKVRLLMIEESPEVEGWLARIEAILNTPAPKRDPASVKYALDGVRAEAAKVILSLGRAPRTLRGTDLPELETALDEIAVGPRQVRSQVSLDDVSDASPVLTRIPRTSEVPLF